MPQGCLFKTTSNERGLIVSDLPYMQNAKETFLATVYTITLLENCI